MKKLTADEDHFLTALAREQNQTGCRGPAHDLLRARAYPDAPLTGLGSLAFSYEAVPLTGLLLREFTDLEQIDEFLCRGELISDPVWPWADANEYHARLEEARRLSTVPNLMTRPADAAPSENEEAHPLMEIIDALLQQDKRAFEEFMNLYGNGITQRAYTRCGDKHLAEDVMVETFKKFNRYIPRIAARADKVKHSKKNCERVEKTVRLIGKHLAIDILRRRQSDRHVFLGVGALAILPAQPDNDSLDPYEDFLNTLSPPDRKVLIRRLENMKIEEIAKELGVTVRQVRRALERIREKYYEFSRRAAHE